MREEQNTKLVLYLVFYLTILFGKKWQTTGFILCKYRKNKKLTDYNISYDSISTSSTIATKMNTTK